MTELDWNELTKLTDRLAVIFELQGQTLSEVEEIVDLISQLYHTSKDKTLLKRAINREGKLQDYQKRRKENSSWYKRKKYQTNKSLALQKLSECTQNGFDSNNRIVYFVFQSSFDFWTEELSQTSKWRIKKELEEQDVRIIETYTDLEQF